MHGKCLLPYQVEIKDARTNLVTKTIDVEVEVKYVPYSQISLADYVPAYWSNDDIALLPNLLANAARLAEQAGLTPVKPFLPARFVLIPTENNLYDQSLGFLDDLLSRLNKGKN